ncbi:MAG: division/cell wall cluster transcriptional repressor MraZ [Chloroflexi bacterium]|nr:division/cell wall cluster transcriptional repressor MraZ [Chloroflexota bacterium]
MFLGSHEHTIDSKGRLTLPAKWRGDLASGVVVTRGLEQCLFIFPQTKFQEIASEIDRQGILLPEARAWARYISGESEAAEVDGQGRILISQKLRNYAGLNGNVVVVGLLSRIEVWSPAKYQTINQQVESDAATVSEKMGQLMLRMAAPEK